MHPPSIARDHPADPRRLRCRPDKVGRLLVPAALQQRLKQASHRFVHHTLRRLMCARNPPHLLLIARGKLRRLLELAGAHQPTDRLDAPAARPPVPSPTAGGSRAKPVLATRLACNRLAVAVAAAQPTAAAVPPGSTRHSRPQHHIADTAWSQDHTAETVWDALI
jgi:hypothetical protein